MAVALVVFVWRLFCCFIGIAVSPLGNQGKLRTEAVLSNPNTLRFTGDLHGLARQLFLRRGRKLLAPGNVRYVKVANRRAMVHGRWKLLVSFLRIPDRNHFSG